MLRGKVIQTDDTWYVLHTDENDGNIHVYYLNEFKY